MPNKTTKKQRILDIWQSRPLERVGATEIRAIEAELRRRFGTNHKTSAPYIANVLREAGARVDYHDRFVGPWMEEPYARRLKGLLRFRNLESAEVSIQKLDAIYREYRAVSDRVGTSLVRSLVVKGKERAESLAANRRINATKRREKGEIARWFRVWLETADLFFDWLDLRKESEEFRRFFGNWDRQPADRKKSAPQSA